MGSGSSSGLAGALRQWGPRQRMLIGGAAVLFAVYLLVGTDFELFSALGGLLSDKRAAYCRPLQEAWGSFPKGASVPEQVAMVTGGRPLAPGERGMCYFHGQLPHRVDRRIFKELGGTIDEDRCCSRPLHTPPLPSEGEVCPCTAPPDPAAFEQAFLEIGALDGTFLSNLLFFESQLGWRGLCVEGSPSNYAQLKRNRPDCATVHAVISPTATELGEGRSNATFYTFTGGWQPSMSCMEGHSVCADRKSAERYAAESGATLGVASVPVHTLAHLFAQRGIAKAGWIMVDVEGAEEIVMSTIDWDAVCARFVSYEGERPPVREALQAAGYRLAAKIGPDSVMTPVRGPCAVLHHAALRRM